MLDALASALGFYLELTPDGRALGREEADSVWPQLGRTAACGRALDADGRLSPALGGGDRLGSSLRLMRSVQHSLVLALSADPARRAQAIPAGELKWRVGPVYEQWRETTDKG